MHAQGLQPRGSGYIAHFAHPPRELPLGEQTEQHRPSGDLTKIMNLINNLNLDDNKSAFTKNERLLKSKETALKNENAHQIYLLAYKSDFSKKPVKKENPFCRPTKESWFREDRGFRARLYNWLLGVAQNLEVTKKVFFRATMVSDLFLVQEYDALYNAHGGAPELLDQHLLAIALSAIFLVSKQEHFGGLRAERLAEFLMLCPGEGRDEVPAKDAILKYELAIFEALDFSLSFDSYPEILERLLLVCGFSADDFEGLRYLCEYFLLRTVLVNNEFLEIDLELLCVALLVFAVDFVYAYWQRYLRAAKVSAQTALRYQRQQHWHVENIKARTLSNSSTINSVCARIGLQVERFERQEEFQELGFIREAIDIRLIFPSEDEL